MESSTIFSTVEMNPIATGCGLSTALAVKTNRIWLLFSLGVISTIAPTNPYIQGKNYLYGMERATPQIWVSRLMRTRKIIALKRKQMVNLTVWFLNHGYLFFSIWSMAMLCDQHNCILLQGEQIKLRFNEANVFHFCVLSRNNSVFRLLT